MCESLLLEYEFEMVVLGVKALRGFTVRGLSSLGLCAPRLVMSRLSEPGCRRRG